MVLPNVCTENPPVDASNIPGRMVRLSPSDVSSTRPVFLLPSAYAGGEFRLQTEMLCVWSRAVSRPGFRSSKTGAS